MYRINISFIFIFLLSFSTHAQTISDKLVRQYRQNSYWLTLRYDQYTESGSFFFFENNNRFNQEPRLGNSFPLSAIYSTYFMAGYEHKAAEKFYLGISERYVAVPGRSSFYTRLNASHRGEFLKLKFIKELAFEHLSHPKSDNPNIIVENEGRVSFAPSLVKVVEVKGKPSLYFILNYRAYMLFDFRKDDFSSYDKRKIDKTELRFEVDYRVSDRFLLSLFAIRDTDYSYRLSISNASNVIIAEEARVNRVSPTFGLSINFLTNAPQGFFPGFPIK